MGTPRPTNAGKKNQPISKKNLITYIEKEINHDLIYYNFFSLTMAYE